MEVIILLRSELSIQIGLDTIPVTAEDECEDGSVEAQKRLVALWNAKFWERRNSSEIAAPPDGYTWVPNFTLPFNFSLFFTSPGFNGLAALGWEAMTARDDGRSFWTE